MHLAQRMRSRASPYTRILASEHTGDAVGGGVVTKHTGDAVRRQYMMRRCLGFNARGLITIGRNPTIDDPQLQVTVRSPGQPTFA